MADNPGMFLISSRQESGNVFKSKDGNIETITEIDETGSLDRRVHIQSTGHHLRLVGDDSGYIASEPGQADNDIGGIVFSYFQKFTFIGDQPDDIPDVIRFVGIFGNKVSETFFYTVRRIVGGQIGSILDIVGRKIGKQHFHSPQSVLVIVESKISDS